MGEEQGNSLASADARTLYTYICPLAFCIAGDLVTFSIPKKKKKATQPDMPVQQNSKAEDKRSIELPVWMEDASPPVTSIQFAIVCPLWEFFSVSSPAPPCTQIYLA